MVKLSNTVAGVLMAIAFFAGGSSWAQSVTAVQAPPNLTRAPTLVGGRVMSDQDGFTYQWPGTYMETAFTGSEVFFRVGPGDVILHVVVDGKPDATLAKPAPGFYRIGDLPAGNHTVRLEVATESQAGPNHFGGFFLSAGETPASDRAHERQIEFIGDSHTVGYGNISQSRVCTVDQVWATTDDTQALGAQTAHHYGADYRINAISGRGIVRNYDGFPADTLPEAYPYLLFDKKALDTDATWQPRVVVIALGTNDFSTPLKPEEKWKNRESLHADYEKTYVSFVRSLRQRYHNAYFVLWATDLANGEIADEVAKVTAQLKQAGETRVSFVKVAGLQMTGCHSHPSVADDKAISDKLVAVIDGVAKVWGDE